MINIRNLGKFSVRTRIKPSYNTQSGCFAVATSNLYQLPLVVGIQEILQVQNECQ